ncbi:MAG: hypothetical protein ABIY37_11415 [Devosia sp.]
MKLTWFGESALRIYVGGQIVVVDPDHAPESVDRGELLAGADRIVATGDALASIDPETWRPKPMPRMTEEAPAVEIARMGQALLIAAAGEAPLVVLGGGELPRSGRWAEGAVIVLTEAREGLVGEVRALLDRARPRLFALAMDDQALDRVISQLAEHLDGSGLVSLEPGLALEV